MQQCKATRRYFIPKRPFYQPIKRNAFTIERHLSSTNSPSQPKLSKTKLFMKKYGYVGISVYLIIGAIDLTTTMTVISVKGANRVKEAEQYVTNIFKGWVGLPVNKEVIKGQQYEKPSLTSIFVIAYGIHKTLLLPLRLSLTAAITPPLVKRLTRLGWLSTKGVK
ncbi:MAG: hypothetical protein EXX96DRAFT_606641 [Benjaminiella poitrasii]|nr:MAG: hypothetical protein EXX96DRAFT_606641 [Benjaminiella poitrasii]